MMRNVFFYSILLFALASTIGCATNTTTPPAPVSATNLSVNEVRALPIFDGDTGESIDWTDMMNRVAAADVAVIGEQHDDAVGHAVQLAIYEDALRQFGSRVALSMEMLERDEQALVDDYLDEIIDQEMFARRTGSERWAGEGSWDAWYQPIIDAAKSHDAPVIAANAPRRYVRLARTDGFDRLDALDNNRQALFDRPAELPTGAYRDRFWNLASEMQEREIPPDNPNMIATFRAQTTWDATMAASIANAMNDPQKSIDKVVHLVGQFHSDFRGGTVTELEQRLPGRRVMTISMQRADAESLREEDADRADVVLYTGDR